MGKAVGEDVPDSLEMGADSKGRLQQIVCYKVGDESKELDLELRRQR